MSLNETKLFRLEDETAEMKKRLLRLEESLSNLEMVVWGIRSGGLAPLPWVQPGEVISTAETASAKTGPNLAQETQQPGRQLSFSFGEQPTLVWLTSDPSRPETTGYKEGIP